MLISVPVYFSKWKNLTLAQVISVHTFCLLFYQLHSPRWVGWIVFILVNGILVMLTFLGPVVYKTDTTGDFCE